MTLTEFEQAWPIPQPDRMKAIRERVMELAEAVGRLGQPAVSADERMLLDLYRGYLLATSPVVQQIRDALSSLAAGGEQS